MPEPEPVQGRACVTDLYHSEHIVYTRHQHVNALDRDQKVTGACHISYCLQSGVYLPCLNRIVVSNDLKWNPHIAYIIHKANSRLHFLRQLKRAAVSHDDMLHFYIGVMRPVLEYAVAVWHTGLTTDLSEQLEAIQKRALGIIFRGSSFTSQSYEPFFPS